MELTTLSRKKVIALSVVCGKPGHDAPQCRHRAKNNYPTKANLAEGEYTIVAVISQVNLVTNVSK